MPIHATDSDWLLETEHTAYAFGLNQAGLLTHRYWGVRLPRPEDYPAASDPVFWAADGAAHFTPHEYPVYGGLSYVDPCLKVSFADGVRDLVLAYVDHQVSRAPQPELTIRLQDTAYPLRLSLHYRLHEAHDLLERWVTLENLGTLPVLVERVYSAKLTLPPGEDYCLTHLYGRHVDEFHIQREPLTQGLKTLESRRIIPSHHASPWFAVDRGASEDAGKVWFGTLAWSGNWKISAEVTEFASTRLSIGLNDWDIA